MKAFTTLTILLLACSLAAAYTFDNYANSYTISNGSQSIKLSTKQINSTHFKLYGEISAQNIGDNTCFLVCFNATNANLWTYSDIFTLSINRPVKILTLGDARGNRDGSNNYMNYYTGDSSGTNQWRYVVNETQADPSFTIETTANSATVKFEVFRNYTSDFISNGDDIRIKAPYEMGSTPVAVNLYNVSCGGPWINTTRYALAGGFTYDGLKPTIDMHGLIASLSFALVSISTLLAF